jgi:hypothetical protein
MLEVGFLKFMKKFKVEIFFVVVNFGNLIENIFFRRVSGKIGLLTKKGKNERISVLF